MRRCRWNSGQYLPGGIADFWCRILSGEDIASKIQASAIDLRVMREIESGELEALEEFIETTGSMHPLLATRIYHKPTDSIDIPAMIVSTETDYGFHVRHESPGTSGTVFSAAPVDRREAAT